MAPRTCTSTFSDEPPTPVMTTTPAMIVRVGLAAFLPDPFEDLTHPGLEFVALDAEGVVEAEKSRAIAGVWIGVDGGIGHQDSSGSASGGFTRYFRSKTSFGFRYL